VVVPWVWDSLAVEDKPTEFITYMYMYNIMYIHVHVHVQECMYIISMHYTVLLYMCIYNNIDREHVVDILPHLWVLDAKMITGKKLEYPM
jgi:hypothetical protein